MDKVEYRKIKPFINIAAKDGVNLKDSKNTSWFLHCRDGHHAIAGLIVNPKTGYARIKGVWVDPIIRGNGVGSSITLSLIMLAKSYSFVHTIEVFAYNRRHYEDRGFVCVESATQKKKRGNVYYLYKRV